MVSLEYKVVVVSVGLGYSMFKCSPRKCVGKLSEFHLKLKWHDAISNLYAFYSNVNLRNAKMEQKKIKVQVVLALATLTILAILHVGNHVVTPPMSLLMNTNTTINVNVSKISVCPASKPPIKSVVFLKTHKTGSESVSGILRKYAIVHIRGINEQVCTFDCHFDNEISLTFKY